MITLNTASCFILPTPGSGELWDPGTKKSSSLPSNRLPLPARTWAGVSGTKFAAGGRFSSFSGELTQALLMAVVDIILVSPAVELWLFVVALTVVEIMSSSCQHRKLRNDKYGLFLIFLLIFPPTFNRNP